MQKEKVSFLSGKKETNLFQTVKVIKLGYTLSTQKTYLKPDNYKYIAKTPEAIRKNKGVYDTLPPQQLLCHVILQFIRSCVIASSIYYTLEINI